MLRRRFAHFSFTHTGADIRGLREKAGDKPGSSNLMTTTVESPGEHKANTGGDQFPRDYIYANWLPSMPDTSNDLERNWLTATATPRFSRAGLPGVVMPVRADSRAKGSRINAAVSHRNGILDSKSKRNNLAPEGGSPSTPSTNPGIIQKQEKKSLDRQDLFHRRQSTEEVNKCTTGPTSKEHYERDFPLTSSLSSSNSVTNPNGTLVYAVSVPKDREKLIQFQSRDGSSDAAMHTKDDRAEIEYQETDLENGKQNGKRWQWSNFLKNRSSRVVATT